MSWAIRRTGKDDGGSVYVVRREVHAYCSVKVHTWEHTLGNAQYALKSVDFIRR